MSEPIAFVSNQAWLQMLVAAVEVFPQKGIRKRGDGETFGYLFGSRTTQRGATVHKVEFAVPCQRVRKRTMDGLHICDVAEARIQSLLTPYPGLDLLGTFHSHPWLRTEEVDYRDWVEPSDADHSSWRGWWNGERDSDEAIELILGLYELQKRLKKLPQQEEKAHTLVGWWDRFKYGLGAYYATRESATSTDPEVLRPVGNLVCPLAWGVTNYEMH